MVTFLDGRGEPGRQKGWEKGKAMAVFFTDAEARTGAVGVWRRSAPYRSSWDFFRSRLRPVACWQEIQIAFLPKFSHLISVRPKQPNSGFSGGDATGHVRRLCLCPRTPANRCSQKSSRVLRASGVPSGATRPSRPCHCIGRTLHPARDNFVR
jgi:hypothetical protein